jgi:AraC-like DNA-binding protein
MADLGSMTHLARLFEFVPDIHFWVKDRQGRFQEANQAFIAHFGFQSLRDLQGKTDFDVSPFHLATEYVADDKDLIASGLLQADKLELVRENDNSLHWYSTTKIALRDNHSQVWGTAGITRRISPVEKGQTAIREMSKVIEYMHHHYSESLTVGQLAEMVQLSVVHFERKFRKLFHDTPLKYLNGIRFRAACQLLLHSELSIAEVARRTGFTDASYFTKRFSAHLSILPKDYRRKFAIVPMSPVVNQP